MICCIGFSSTLSAGNCVAEKTEEWKFRCLCCAAAQSWASMAAE